MKLLPAVLACLAVLGCQKPPQADPPPLTKDQVNAETLWKRITVETDFDNYPFWPGHEGMRPGQSPHGKFHEVYVNPTLRAALPAASSRAPVGSIIVKENFDSSKHLTKISVMAKVEGFNPEAGDWFWANYGSDGKATASGAVDACIACHEGMKDNDYVIIRRLNQ